MKKYFVAYLFLAVSIGANAYERVTHQRLSDEAAKKSLLKDPAILSKLGLDPKAIDDNGYNLFPTSEGGRTSILEVIKFGADWEDGRNEKVQATRHFFNPLTNEALNAGPFILPVSPFYISKISGIRSPDWALEDAGTYGDVSIPQRFSYRWGRKYFLDALTLPAKADRDDKWGLTFQTLGHVIHHIQDMAQPQHTRNDFHCDDAFCESTGLLGGVKPSFEKWTLNNPDISQYPGYEPVYTKEETNGLTTPRMFWLGGGKGIADFSNRNFFTAGTNVGSSGFSSPQLLGNPQKVDVTLLCDEAVQKGRANCPQNLRGTMTFYAADVIDKLRGNQSGINVRATSRSIYDADLKKRVLGYEAFSVNRFTYDATNDFTLKRAVGYSAGIINYFFRGEMDLKEDLANLGKFAVKNGSNETMEGTLSLHYDLEDGQRNRAAGFNVNVDPQTEAAVAIPVSDFKEMPYRVDNEAYMMVFKGALGEERPTGASPGAVMATQIRIRNVFDIYDTLYQPESNYLKGYMWLWFDWQGEGRLELKSALKSALLASRVAINGHKLAGSDIGRYGVLGYVSTSDFYAQMQVSTRTDARNGDNYLYIQNVNPLGVVEVTVDGRVVASFNWQSNGARFTVIKPFRVVQR